MLLSTLLRPARRALLLRHLPPLHHQPSVTQSSSRFYHHRPPPKGIHHAHQCDRICHLLYDWVRCVLTDGFIALSSVRGYLNEGREGAGRGAVGNFSSDDRAQLLKRAATVALSTLLSSSFCRSYLVLLFASLSQRHCLSSRTSVPSLDQNGCSVVLSSC